MTVYDVRDALLSATDNVYHYDAPQAVKDSGETHVIWGETGIGSLAADDGPEEWIVSGSAYLYTQEEYDGLFDALCERLAEAGISVRPGRIGYDDESAQITYELNWSVSCAPFALYAADEEEEDGA